MTYTGKGTAAAQAYIWDGTKWVTQSVLTAVPSWDSVLAAGNTSGGTNAVISNGDALVLDGAGGPVASLSAVGAAAVLAIDGTNESKLTLYPTGGAIAVRIDDGALGHTDVAYNYLKFFPAFSTTIEITAQQASASDTINVSLKGSDHATQGVSGRVFLRGFQNDLGQADVLLNGGDVPDVSGLASLGGNISGQGGDYKKVAGTGTAGAISFTAGDNDGLGLAGYASLQAGAITNASNTNQGGNVSITAGNTAGSGYGGPVDIRSGNSTTGIGGFITLTTGTGVSDGGSISLTSGASTSASGISGAIDVKTGDATVAGARTGNLSLKTGDFSATGPSGQVSLSSGNQTSSTSNGTTGTVTVTSGDLTGSGNSGNLQLRTGSQLNASSGGSSGSISIQSGEVAGGGGTGGVALRSGFASGTASTGSVVVESGSSGSGFGSGAVLINTGYVNGASGGATTGNIELTTGECGKPFGGSGLVRVKTGDRTSGSGSGSSGVVEIVTGTASVAGYGSGGVTISTGTAVSGSTGGISLQVGSSTSGAGGSIGLNAGSTTSGTAGSVAIAAGNGGSSSGGNVTIDAGDSTSGGPGQVTITGGSSGSTVGGNVTLVGGTGASPWGGFVNITGGPTTSVSALDFGGRVNITGGQGASCFGGDVNVTGGPGLYGNSVTISGGTSTTTVPEANEKGGHVFLLPGLRSDNGGTKTYGRIVWGNGPNTIPDDHWALPINHLQGGFIRETVGAATVTDKQAYQTAFETLGGAAIGTGTLNSVTLSACPTIIAPPGALNLIGASAGVTRGAVVTIFADATVTTANPVIIGTGGANASVYLTAPWQSVVLEFLATTGAWEVRGGAGYNSQPHDPYTVSTHTADPAPGTVELRAKQHTYVMDTTAAPRTITLPNPPPARGTVVTVKDSGNGATNNVTVSSAANIDGAASRIITANYGSLTVQSDGTTYWII